MKEKEMKEIVINLDKIIGVILMITGAIMLVYGIYEAYQIVRIIQSLN